jgi:OOP family OmpA-OmpF porin
MPEGQQFQAGMTQADSTNTLPEKESGEASAPGAPEPTLWELDARGIPREKELQRLRSMLFQAEIDKISALEHRLNDQTTRAHETGDVLADAVVARAAQDDLLDRVFEPIVESSLKASLRKNPNEFVNVFFPLIGSTIRRSMAETFNTMLGSFSKGLEQSFSIRGIRWRIEALRSGKPFNEIVMLNTMLYSVEQVFLIHGETGLVLSHVVNEGVTSKDADLVSGMLTAIQDFARDCFDSDGQSSSLDSLRMDEYTIYLVQSPLVYIACVVRGTPPGDFLGKVNLNLELILAQCTPFLAGFRGDTTPFEVAKPYLQDCLDRKLVDDERAMPVWARKAAIGAGVFVVLLFLASQIHSWRMKTAVGFLQKEPGLLVLDVQSTWGFRAWKVLCFQDELARPAATVLSENGYHPEALDVQSIPFVSLEPEIVRLRVIKKTEMPEGVEIGLKDGVLFLSGTADMGWILQARQIALATPGVLGIDTSAVHDPRATELTDLILSIETAVIRFVVGSDVPVPSDQRALDKAIDDLVALESLAKSMGLAVNLSIYGHADATGSDRRNFDISQSRARVIASRLFARHTNIPIVMYGIGADLAHGEDGKRESGYDLDKRKIDLRVRLVMLSETHQLLLPKNQ